MHFFFYLNILSLSKVLLSNETVSVNHIFIHRDSPYQERFYHSVNSSSIPRDCFCQQYYYQRILSLSIVFFFYLKRLSLPRQIEVLWFKKILIASKDKIFVHPNISQRDCPLSISTNSLFLYLYTLYYQISKLQCHQLHCNQCLFQTMAQYSVPLSGT